MQRAGAVARLHSKKFAHHPSHWTRHAVYHHQPHQHVVLRLSRSLASSAAPAQQQQHIAAETHQPTPVTSAYIHLPFCKRKCFYCDFPVEAVGLDVSKSRTQDRMAAYVELVCAEIRATNSIGGQGAPPLETVSFGGGTPSLIPPHLLERLLTTLQQQYGISFSAEVSLEADPGTFDLQRLQAYKALGVNRLSMGVQCFDQELLQTCGRSHTLSDVYAAIEAVTAAGFPSWSLDLISGLPKLTLDTWQHSLREAVAAGPNHISIYDLQVEQGTPFARWYGQEAGTQNSPLPQEPEAVAMFEAASATLAAAGYEHYEISNYAQPGHRSRHNQVYWHCQPYYAFGLGAASYTRGRRFTRPRGMREYEAWVGGYVASGAGCPAAQLPPEGQEDRLLDLIMLQLRLSDGLDLHHLQQQFGQRVVSALLPVLQQMMQRGLMQLLQQETALQQQQSSSSQHGSSGLHDQQPSAAGAAGAVTTAAAGAGAGAGEGGQHTCSDGGGDSASVLQDRLTQGLPCRVRLTDPQGFLLSNDVIAELFAVLDPSMLVEV